MKRGKDEKIMGPMFPRLHVNDTEKGGPRAPPRNKMALYEQLTVPSRRYNTDSTPRNPNDNSSLASSTSNQGTGRERNMYFPLYQPPLSPSREELQVCQSETLSSINEPTQVEGKKKPAEEDGFMVRVFTQPEIRKWNGKPQISIGAQRDSHLYPKDPMAILSNGSKQTHMSGSGDFIPVRHAMNQEGRSLRVSGSPARSSDMSGGKHGGSRAEDIFVRHDHQEDGLTILEKRLDHDDSLLAADAMCGEGASELQLESTKKEIPWRLKHNPRVGCRYKEAYVVDNGMPRVEDDLLLESDLVDRGNDMSETSLMDSVLGMDMSPDDVVGVIGQKHFWKARTAIVNQQRVFAVQVFELHRLIEVQKLIAGSPDLLLEGNALTKKTILKDSAVKNYSSDYEVVKALANTIKQKEDGQKPTDKMEGCAENAVAKVPLPYQNATQAAGFRPDSENALSSPPANTDPKMTPWSFQQPPLHQWLVPVMSPSEGLVYKPYPAPGMVGPAYGGCGPAGLIPMVGNLMNMPYGMPNPHYHQGMGVPPAIHFGGQGYFPAYAMPTMCPSVSGSAVDQINQCSGPNPYGQRGQPAAGSANYSLPHQSSCNMPIKKTGAAVPSAVALPFKKGEQQGSTASSPSERAQGTGMSVPTEGRGTLPPFFMSPSNKISEAAASSEKPSSVIRVVPHNPKSTRESAARIFQFIQAEKTQNEAS